MGGRNNLAQQSQNSMIGGLGKKGKLNPPMLKSKSLLLIIYLTMNATQMQIQIFLVTNSWSYHIPQIGKCILV